MIILFGVVIIALVYGIMLKIITQMEESLIADRLSADIHYIEDLIGNGDWHVKSGGIYRGDILIGDGTEEKANFAPFFEHERKTGTLSYVFIKCSDEGLSFVKGTTTKKGYQQGHFLRVAGSTKNPDGKSIVGTYIEKQVADVLDEEDIYKGEANVAGGMIYCQYNTLKNREGEVVGVIVVGRYITELRHHVNGVIQALSFSVGAALILLGVILFLFVNRWISIIRQIVSHLKILEEGHIPENPLSFSAKDEMQTVVTGINHLVDSLREKEILRKRSEIDQLTGLANRFGLNRYAEEVFENAYENSQSLSIGIIDIDFFKPFNDNYGHQAGDECIVMLGTVLKEIEKERGVFCARFGGDEFIIICKDKSKEEVANIASEIKRKVQSKGITHSYSPVSNIVTVSQGYSYGLSMKYRKLNDYISVADGAMYQVKNSAKNDFNIIEMGNHARPIVTCPVKEKGENRE